MDSILTSCKSACGLAELDVSFDSDILIWVNTAVAELKQLGILPDEYVVVDKTQTYSALGLSTTLRQMVNAYLSIRTKVRFDPPSNQSIMNALELTTQELQSRMLTQKELLEVGDE